MKNFFCQFRQKLEKPLVTSLIINLVVFIALNMISYSKFLCNIDIMMQAVIANITGGLDSSYAIFMNIFLLKILKTLYMYFPKVSWYMILQVLVCFISLTIIGKSYLSEKRMPMHKMVYVVFCVLVGFECYIYPSYVKSSFILCFAMVLQIIKIAKLSKKFLIKASGIIFGLILSGLLCKIGFLAGIITGIIYYVITNTYCRTFGKHCYIHLLLVLLSVAGIIGLWIVNDQTYAVRTQNWDVVKEYRNAVEKIELFGCPDYSEEIGERIDISEAKYNCMKYYDEYIAVGDAGLNIISKISRETLSWKLDNIIKYFHTVPIRWVKVSLAYLLLLACAFMCESDAKHKRTKIIVAAIWIFVFYMIAYMNCIWNSKVTHFMVFIPIAYWIMTGVGDEFDISVKENVVFIMVFSVVLYYNFSDQFISSVQEKPMNEVFEQSIAEEGITALNLNNILRQYSAYEPYESGLLLGHNVLIANGAYQLFERFEPYMYKIELWDEPIMWNGYWMDMNLYRYE